MRETIPTSSVGVNKGRFILIHSRELICELEVDLLSGAMGQTLLPHVESDPYD